jgi:hypothetical protein
MSIASLLIPRGKALVLRTDGREELVDHPRGDDLRRLIGASIVDTVTLTWTKQHQADLVMMLDDHGWEFEIIEHSPGHHEHRPTVPRFPFNDRATELYREVAPKSGHRIVGDVAIVHDDD